MPEPKAIVQFWVSIAAILGLILLAITCVVLDHFAAAPSDRTLMTVGGVISVASICATWLYRNGARGNGSKEEA